jgi:hypothetical protein
LPGGENYNKEQLPPMCSLWILAGVLSSITSTAEGTSGTLESLLPQTLKWVKKQRDGAGKSMKAINELTTDMAEWAGGSLKDRVDKSVKNIEDASQNMADASEQLKNATSNFGSPSAPSAPDGGGMMKSSALGGDDDDGSSNDGGTYTGTGFSNPLSRRLRFRRR